MALLEAQAFGIPAVSFDCKCGPREIIRDGESGYIVPEGDVAALAEAMKRLMTDDGLRKRMGMCAFKNADNWRTDRIMQKWISLFQEIL